MCHRAGFCRIKEGGEEERIPGIMDSIHKRKEAYALDGICTFNIMSGQ
jgi:hypothetical protein